MPTPTHKSWVYKKFALLVEPDTSRVYRDYIGTNDRGRLLLSTPNPIKAATYYTDLLQQQIMQECREVAAAQGRDRYTGELL